MGDPINQNSNHMQAQHVTTELVLVGGGHSHLSVITDIARHAPPELRVTVISRDIHTPYSGMVPGLIAGHYAFDDAHIDLRPLCQFANVRLFNSSVIAIDMQKQQVICDNRAPVRFDYLSINTGSQPALQSIKGAQQCGIAVKPIDRFLQYWHTVLGSLAKQPRPASIAVVGGGAASIEVILAIEYQLRQTLGKHATLVHLELICAGNVILPTHHRRVQRRMLQILRKQSVNVRTGCSVLSARRDTDNSQTLLELSNNQTLTCDNVIWAIHAGSPPWLRETGLECCDDGFIKVNSTLQSVSHNNVFAAGDCACFSAKPLAKSGVYAVRAGKVLAANLLRIMRGQRLVNYRPQSHFLSLLLTGDTYAIASKGRFSAEGKWLWRVKNHIDRQFVLRYNQLSHLDKKPTGTTFDPGSSGATPTDKPLLPQQTHSKTPAVIFPRCGGYDVNISQRMLSRVIASLHAANNQQALSVSSESPGGTVITPPPGKVLLQKLNYMGAFIDDAYLLGRIAATHCLSDIYASGATPHSALALAMLPNASKTVRDDELFQLLCGAATTLIEHHTALLGGRSSDSTELGFGLSFNALLNSDRHLANSTPQSGHQLIISKAIGSGALLTANSISQAQGRWVEQTLQHMLLSNKNAATIIHSHNASICKHIAGRGLIGHLLEILQDSSLAAHIHLSAIPLLTGSEQCAQNGWLCISQCHVDTGRHINNAQNFASDTRYQLLFDAQISGGLLAAVPVEQAVQCVKALHEAGYLHATIVGSLDNSQRANSITLLD